MNKLLILGAAALGAVATGASAHPTDIYYDTFGACSAALQQDNKLDRDMFVQYFPSMGAAEIDMINNWQCVYDGTAWHIEGQPGGGDNLGNGNGQANPGGN